MKNKIRYIEKIKTANENNYKKTVSQRLQRKIFIVSNVLLILLFIKIIDLIREFSSIRKGAVLGIDLANFCL